MLRQQKEIVIAELVERLRSTQTLIVADYRGLTMKQLDALRSQLLEHGAKFSVVKNTLTRRAAEAAGADALLALLEGPSAIAFIESDGDPIAVAKALADAARTTLITWIFFSPAAVRTTSNAVCSSAAAPSPAAGAPGMAATATGAAAVTPHASSSAFFNSTSSSTVIFPSCSTSAVVSVAI